MINWFDMPAEGLSNGGLFEIKELTATENKVYQKDGEVYNKVTVNVPSPTGKITITENGTDIDIAQYATADVNVEGGGGSSDFSTAEVTFICSAGSYSLCHSAIENGNLLAGAMDMVYDNTPLTVMIPLLNGRAILDQSAFYDIDAGVPPTTTGSIEFGQSGIIITGDGTITAKGSV